MRQLQLSRHRAHALGAFSLILTILLLLTGCATATGAPRQGHSVVTFTPTSTDVGEGSEGVPFTITVPGTDLFTPYIAVVPVGTPVRWVNADTMLHTVIGGPTADGGVINPLPFQLVLQPGDQQTLTLRTPGLYYYYCGAHATLGFEGRAASLPTTRTYPLAMDGFIYAVGPGLSGLPATAIAITDAGTFTPWITVMNQGAHITWTNPTAQAVTIATTQRHGALNPVPLAVQIPSGGSVTQTLNTPGIYDYYRTQAASLDATWNRPIAHPGAPGYPVPAEGIIVVLGS